MLNLSGFDIIP